VSQEFTLDKIVDPLPVDQALGLGGGKVILGDQQRVVIGPLDRRHVAVDGVEGRRCLKAHVILTPGRDVFLRREGQIKDGQGHQGLREVATGLNEVG